MIPKWIKGLTADSSGKKYQLVKGAGEVVNRGSQPYGAALLRE